MKKLALAATLLLGAAVAGCGKGPCDVLQDTCNGCKDQTKKDSCDTAVRTYKAVPTGDTACQSLIDAHTYDGC
jgi:hypothetical protein